MFFTLMNSVNSTTAVPLMWLLMLLYTSDTLQVRFKLQCPRQPVAIITDLGPVPHLLLKTLQGNTFTCPHFLVHKLCYLAFCTHFPRAFITTANCLQLSPCFTSNTTQRRHSNFEWAAPVLPKLCQNLQLWYKQGRFLEHVPHGQMWHLACPPS